MPQGGNVDQRNIREEKDLRIGFLSFGLTADYPKRQRLMGPQQTWPQGQGPAVLSPKAVASSVMHCSAFDFLSPASLPFFLHFVPLNCTSQCGITIWALLQTLLSREGAKTVSKGAAL